MEAAEQKKLAQKVMTIRMIAGSVGTIAGAAVAYKRGSGFWGYVGFMLLGGIVIGSIGTIATASMVSRLETE